MAIIGKLEFTTEDGTVLQAPNDLRLAWKWAEHEAGEKWTSLTHGEKCDTVADALRELRAKASDVCQEQR